MTVFATSTLLTPADDLFEKYLKRRTDGEEPEDMADLFEEARNRELTKQSGNDIITFGEDSQNLIDEVISNKKKITPENVIGIVRDQHNKIIWIEIGNKKAGLNHIINEHSTQFQNKGISDEEIPNYIMEAIHKGNIVGYQGKQNPRTIYEFTYKGKKQRVAIQISNNGFIVSANPKSVKE